VVNCGGIAEKSPLTMQIYADVLGRPMKVSRSAQTCALGSAVMASVVGGAHKDTLTAISAMAGVKDEVFRPEPKAVDVYNRLYTLYEDLHDSFGKVSRHPDLHGAMKELIKIREMARS
jgi:L-ribulokinase